MADYFLDTSALVKFYHPEQGTPDVERIMTELNARRFSSRLAMVEMQSVFAGKVRSGEIPAGDFDLYRKRFLTDVSQRKVGVARLSGAYFQEAEQLLKKYGMARRLRTLDALQLAVAIDLKNRGLLTHFVCADKHLCTVAATEGFTIIDPREP